MSKFRFSRLAENIHRNSASHWREGRAKEPKIETVLEPWKVYESWSPLCCQQRDKVEMRQWGETKLDHNIPEESVLFEKEGNGNAGGRAGIFIDAVVMCFTTKFYMVIAAIPYLKECLWRNTALLHNETGSFASLWPLCTNNVNVYSRQKIGNYCVK